MAFPSRQRLLLLALPVLLLALAIWQWQTREPVWEGQPLSHWLENLAVPCDSPYEEPTGPGELAAYRAIRGMGTNAIPFLLRRMSQPAPAPWEEQVMRLEYMLEARRVRYPWRRVSEYTYLKEFATIRGFFALGTLAQPAVPELCRRLNSTNWTETWRAAHILARMGANGVEAVFGAATNSAAVSRAAAAFGLGIVVTNHAKAFAVIVGMKSDSDAKVRASVAGSLARSEGRAEEAIPVLIGLLTDSDLSVRQIALQSLGNIAHGKFTGDFSAAVPALVALKTDPDKRLSQKASNLLEFIASPGRSTPVSK